MLRKLALLAISEQGSAQSDCPHPKLLPKAKRDKERIFWWLIFALADLDAQSDLLTSSKVAHDKATSHFQLERQSRLQDAGEEELEKGSQYNSSARLDESEHKYGIQFDVLECSYSFGKKRWSL